MSEASTSYNAVPLPAVLGAPTPAAEAPAEDAAPPPTAAHAKLAMLKAKLSSARSQNHKAVVAEDRRNKLGDAGLKRERQEQMYEKKQKQQEAEGRSKPTESEMQLETTAWDARAKGDKEEKKQKRRNEHGWDVFNNEAQYRHYKKQLRRANDEGHAPGEGEIVDEGDQDPLAYGQAPPVAKERVQALVEDMHGAAVRRAAWSRRRTFHEDQDVTYINKRNEVYNKKIQRAFDPYTTEIRANLERGTAL